MRRAAAAVAVTPCCWQPPGGDLSCDLIHRAQGVHIVAAPAACRPSDRFAQAGPVSLETMLQASRGACYAHSLLALAGGVSAGTCRASAESLGTDQHPRAMSKIAIATDRAPPAIGPYSQAVRAGNLLFCSGQIALEPGSGELVSGGIEPQTRQVLDNLQAVLSAAGADWDNVVKTTIYLRDLGDFQQVNTIYAERFQAVAPARATVEASGLPKGALVEIDALAYLEED